jgi:hypothetical protein
MTRNKDPGRARLRLQSVLGAASLVAILALAPAEAARRKRTPWVDPPGPGQTAVPETPPVTGSLPAATPPGPGNAEALKPAGQAGNSSVLASDTSTQRKPATKSASIKRTDSRAGQKARNESGPTHVRTAKSRRAKMAAEAKPSDDQVADDLRPFDDELTYDEVVRNGVELDPSTIEGLPRGYRVYSLRTITTRPIGPPVVVMRQRWPNRAYIPYRRF